MIQSFRTNHLTNCVAHNEINVQTEEEIYRSVINWFKHDVTGQRKRHSPLILPLIRYKYMDPNFLTTVVMRDPIYMEWDPDQTKLRSAYHESTSVPLVRQGRDGSQGLPDRNWNYSTSRLSAGVDRLLVVGGVTQEGTALREIELYDPILSQWTFAEPMSDRRDRFGLAVVKNIAYVIGGMDPITKQAYRTIDR